LHCEPDENKGQYFGECWWLGGGGGCGGGGSIATDDRRTSTRTKVVS